MKKLDIIKLYNAGIVEVSAQTLPAAHAYKVFKLKREVEKAYKAIEEEQEGIMEQQGLTKGYRQEIAEIINMDATSRTDAQKAKVKEYTRAMQTVNDLFEQQGKDDVSLDIKTIPYQQWRKLQAENKDRSINGRQVDILSGIAEIILCEVFWQEPTEEDIKEEPEKKDNQPS